MSTSSSQSGTAAAEPRFAGALDTCDPILPEATSDAATVHAAGRRS